MTSPVPAEPDTPAEALERVRSARRRLASHIAASAHLLDAPFSNAPDQSPWTKIKAAMTAFDEAVVALARSTDPVPAPTTYALPAEPRPEVIELWAADGGHVERNRAEHGGWWYRGMVWRWSWLVEKAGPLSTARPETQDAEEPDYAPQAAALLRRKAAARAAAAAETPLVIDDDSVPPETEAPDPTHGRIDRDIQAAVDGWGPKTLGQRVAVENTMQTLRDRGEVAADRCLNCNRPLVRRGGKLVHGDGDANRCGPGTEAGQ